MKTIPTLTPEEFWTNYANAKLAQLAQRLGWLIEDELVRYSETDLEELIRIVLDGPEGGASRGKRDE